MLVYRDAGRRVNSRGELARLRRAAEAIRTRDAALAFVIRVGEFEAGIADALTPDTDSVHSTAAAMRGITEEAAAAWLAMAQQDGERRTPSLARRLTQFEAQRLPISIDLRVSEGYAYSALFPETYAASATRFAEDTGARRIHAIGIRSIGTSLSAVVAAALRRAGRTVTTSTVRPRGHPFDRTLRIDGSVADLLRREAAQDAWFAIVDEGPGLSGSSFAAVAAYLRSLDIPASRITLFPSWNPEPDALRSEPARKIWQEHSRYAATAEPSLSPERVFGLKGGSVDMSAGRWRSVLLAPRTPNPAVQPQHERLKVLAPGAKRVIRFAGLGAYGTAIAERAATLAGLGLGEQPGQLRSGFLELPFVAGTPLSRCEATSDAETIGMYIARVASAFPDGSNADTKTLVRMIETNLKDVVPRLHIHPPADLPAAALDSRMLAHEWIRTAHGLVKVDALDHHAGHFLPGPQSPAWDLAGAGIELQMNDAQQQAMLTAFERAGGDRAAVAALPFYRLAYSAFRLGYATLASETLAGTDDAARFARAAERYSQCALNAAACFTTSSKSPLEHERDCRG